MNLLASLGGSAAIGGATTGAATAIGSGGIFDGLLQSGADLAAANTKGAGLGTASQAFAKMFGGQVADNTVQDLNTFQVGGQMKRKQEDPLDNTRQQFQDWMSLMSFTS